MPQVSEYGLSADFEWVFEIRVSQQGAYDSLHETGPVLTGNGFGHRGLHLIERIRQAPDQIADLAIDDERRSIIG